ncbi:MAG: peptide-methionine (S)-S-oxide reductase, partial [Psychroserpens sp.]|nr:peptide-methionine (S)-S-oxide reductase [Psychroserpens sp.]
EQKAIAEAMIKELNPHFENKIVTEIAELDTFFEAEKEHQDFYERNPDYGYCTYVINPKMSKLRKLHADKLK